MKYKCMFMKVEEGYIAWAEDLPGANSQGATLDEARENLREAIELIQQANRDLEDEEEEGK